MWINLHLDILTALAIGYGAGRIHAMMTRKGPR